MEAPDFFVDDLLNLPNGDEMMADAFFENSPAENSTDSSAVTPVDSSNSSLSHAADITFPFSDNHFSGELCVPYDDLAELEWLSNFVEESFSSEDLRHHHHHHHTRPEPESAILRPDGPVPGKARSKLSRVAPSDWSTRLLMVSPTSSSTVNHHHQVGLFPKKPAKKRAENSDDSSANGEAVRRCLHCAAEKTPQWRTGPMGPKTLCNACGVRYKSGRLVPEYRPAASPTFVSAKHSNSHRKVLELRRQREAMQRQHQHHQLGPAFIGGGDDYMIHHHHHDYRQQI